MQYIQIKDGKIMAVTDWQFPDSIPAKEEVVRNEEGQFVFKSELDETHEQAVRDKREADRLAAEEAKAAEEARVPDLEDATVDLATYIAELDARIAELEAAKEAKNG